MKNFNKTVVISSGSTGFIQQLHTHSIATLYIIPLGLYLWHHFIDKNFMTSHFTLCHPLFFVLHYSLIFKLLLQSLWKKTENIFHRNYVSQWLSSTILHNSLTVCKWYTLGYEIFNKCSFAVFAAGDLCFTKQIVCNCVPLLHNRSPGGNVVGFEIQLHISTK